MPIGAALLAAVLALQAWGERGLPIVVQFDDGHGLRAGDVVRHRGIVVGEVESVSLSPGLESVEVALRLDDHASDLARVGSRFWIVRPQLGLERIAGLETLIGARYLAVLPGRGAPQRRFVGLTEAPVPDALEKGGLDVVLEGTHRGSLQPGSPVTYRKIRVGTVISLGLASDARTVEVHARIRSEYASLIRARTRFWDSSGVSLDLGITGVTLHLDTLQALAMGGVSLATPPDAGPVVSTGHRFPLAAEADSDWLAWSPSLPVGSSALPPGVAPPRPLRARLTWKETRFFTWTASAEQEGWVLAVPEGLLGPADLFHAEPQAHEGTSALEVAGATLSLDVETREAGAGLALLPLAPPPAPPWPAARRRHAEAPEDCLVIANPADEPRGLSAARCQPDGEGGWRIDGAIAFDAGWHGACVVGRSDGRLLGLLLVSDEVARVALLP